MEFLLVNHPLDCPICDQAGECKLQEQATGYGRGYSRYIEQKNVKPKRTALGPRVTLDDERCILCSRCIRFCKEVAKDDVLGFIDRGQPFDADLLSRAAGSRTTIRSTPWTSARSARSRARISGSRCGSGS